MSEYNVQNENIENEISGLDDQTNTL